MSTAFIALLVVASTVFTTVSARCSAVTTPEGTYNATSGSIMSDTDGYGSQNTVYDDDCTWFVQCPADTVFAVTDLDFDPWSNGYDVLTVRDNVTNTVARTWSSNVVNQNLITSYSTVRVTFKSVTSNTGTDDGFTMRYACIPYRCAAKNSSGAYIGNSQLTERSGSILSDSDGYGSSYKTVSGEFCNFTIACPFTYATVWKRTSFSSTASLTIGTGSVSFGSASPSGYSAAPYVALSTLTNNQLPIEFTGGSTSSNGYSLHYACSNAKCSSATAGTTFSDASGSFKTDIDGPGSTYHLSEENCKWTIACPSSANNYLFYNLYGTIGVDTNVTVRSQPSGTADYSIASPLTSKAISSDGIIDLMMGLETVEMTFTANGSPAQGVDFSYLCRDSQCSSATGGQTLTDRFGKILTDTDGSGGAQYFSGEQCQWRIECPAGYQNGIAVNLVGYTRSTDTVTFTPDSGTPTTLSSTTSYGSTTPWSQMYSTSGMNISLTTGASGTGFTISWFCMAQPSCTSANTTDAGVNQAAGTITTDGDGEGSAYYFAENEQCSWSISCPAPSNANYIRLYSSGLASSLYSGYGLTYRNGADTTTLYTVTDGCCTRSPLYIAASVNATVKFTSSSVRSNRGVDVNWACTANKCPVDDGITFTADNGTIKTDRDGHSTTYQYASGEQCRWTIKCPLSFNFTYIKVIPNTYYSSCSYDRVTIKSGSRTEMTACGSITTTKLIESNDVDVAWDVSSTRVDGGATIEYSCRNKQCTNAAYTNDVTDANGTIRSDTDGYSTSYTQDSGEYCARNVECPAGFGYIAMKIQYRLGSGARLTVGGNVYTTTSTSSFTRQVMIVGNSAAIELDTMDATVASVGGYTITYQCQKQQCLSLSPPTQTAVTGSIKSDIDGYFSSFHYNNGDKCEWIASCPTDRPYRFMVLTGRGEMASGGLDRWDIRNAQTYSLVESGSSTFETIDDVATGNSIRVTLNASTSGNADGLTVNWVCSETFCKASDSSTTYTNPSARYIASDSSGSSSSTRGSIGEECFWRLRCTSGTLYFSSLNFDIGRNRIVFLDNSGGALSPNHETMSELPFNFTGQFSWSRFYLNATDVFVTYNVSEVADGFSFYAYCTTSVSNCVSSTTTTSSGSSAVTTYKTDSDGVGFSRLGTGTCLVNVKCPASAPAALVHAQYSIASSTLALFSDIGVYGQQSLKTISSSASSTKLYMGMPAQVQIYSTSSSASSRNYGVTLNYTCVSSRCTSPIASGVRQTLSSCLSTIGTGCNVSKFGSDANGDGRGAFIDGELCTWPVQCAAGQYLALRVPVKPTSATIAIEQPPTTSAEVTYTTSLSSFPGKWAYSTTNSLQLSMSASGSGSSNLLTEARCAPSRCDASEILRTAESETIYFGGSSTRAYSLGSKCAFEIRCPAGLGTIRFECSGSARTSSDRVYFDELRLAEDNENAEVVRSGFNSIRSTSLSKTVTSTSTSSGMWRIRFESVFSSSTRSVGGARCKYTCQSGGITGGSTPAPWWSSPAPGSSRSTSSSSSSDDNTGVVVGAVIGGIVFFCIIVGIAVFVGAMVWQKRQREQRDNTDAAGSPSTIGVRNAAPPTATAVEPGSPVTGVAMEVNNGLYPNSQPHEYNTPTVSPHPSSDKVEVEMHRMEQPFGQQPSNPAQAVNSFQTQWQQPEASSASPPQPAPPAAMPPQQSMNYFGGPPPTMPPPQQPMAQPPMYGGAPYPQQQVAPLGMPAPAPAGSQPSLY